jgi:hypothetical protein
MSRKIKSVSFNLHDQWEKDMYDYALKFPNFSSFIKRLIQNAMSGISENKPVQKVDKSLLPQMEIKPEHLKQLI